MSLLQFRKLFGREAAEDEKPERLAEYFVKSRDFEDFDDEEESFLLVRGKKGTGKSAVLSYYAHILEKQGEHVISTKGPTLQQYFNSELSNPNGYVNEWERAICSLVSIELGNNIGVALTSDEMTLVEFAEVEGLKKKNIVRALLDRFKIKLAGIELQSHNNSPANNLVKRHLENCHDENIWLFIDDIDQTFINDSDSRYRLSSFLTACRYLGAYIPSLKIRVSMRDDVWWSISREDEALDKIPQFIRPIKWNSSDTIRILGKRVEVFFNNNTKAREAIDPDWLKKPFYAVFPFTFSWNKSRIPSGFIVHMYALGRPRWAIQLGRLCIETARRQKDLPDKININVLMKSVPEYSKHKLGDLIAEYDHECPQLREIIYSFYGGGSRWTTNALKTVLGSKVMGNLDIVIDDNKKPKPQQVAHFLYRIGFINAFVPGQKKEDEEFFRYEEKPHLLSLHLNEDDGFHWSIHPAFHSTLNLSQTYKKNNVKVRRGQYDALPT